jgi:excinuclease ABC subunit A
LLSNLRNLVDLGSTVVVVEHDADTIRAADYLIDLGPGGGARGGEVMAAGAPRDVLELTQSPTARALSSPAALRTPRPITKKHPMLRLEGASAHNLKNVCVEFPIGRLSVVAGVSGSGKSTLVRQVLLPALRARLGLVAEAPGPFKKLSGEERLVRAVAVDQSPIGRTPRSVPATFLGIWDTLRKIYAATPDAKVAGFDAARFSFNTPRGGRCPACQGQGVTTHEMSFLPDVTTPCAVCEGARFEPQTLDVRYLGYDVGELLRLTAEQAAEVYANHPDIAGPLRTLVDLGAGYICLGQGSHTLSGGEAQRLKLAAELTATTRHQPTLYVLDEPTTGLHLADVAKLVGVLDRLVERGDTLIVIEHHPEVIAGADYVVELGPEGGARGGGVVARGVVRDLAGRQTPTAEVVRRFAR